MKIKRWVNLRRNGNRQTPIVSSDGVNWTMSDGTPLSPEDLDERPPGSYWEEFGDAVWNMFLWGVVLLFFMYSMGSR